MNTLKRLASIADQLDQLGLTAEADELDTIISEAVVANCKCEDGKTLCFQCINARDGKGSHCGKSWCDKANPVAKPKQAPDEPVKSECNCNCEDCMTAASTGTRKNKLLIHGMCGSGKCNYK